MSGSTDQKQALDRLIEAVEAGEAQEWQFLSLHTIQQADDAHRAFHGSLDAAKALHGALLPGWMLPCMVSWYINEAHGVTVEIYGRNDEGEAVATHESMARAWLLAILRAYRGTLA